MRIDGETQLVGLIGWPVAHSLSPAMHNAAFAAMGLNWAYVPLPAAPVQIEDTVRGLAALGFRGANVTVPHKEAVLPLLDEIHPAAGIIGAVNTIIVDHEADGYSSGANTDWRGFLADLDAHDVEVGGRDCVVLGAGGSARAVVYGLSVAGGQVHLVARRIEQAQQLRNEIGTNAVRSVWPLAALEEVVSALTAPLVVNTTPLGMSPFVEQSAWPEDVPFGAGTFAYDLVYRPAETRFMRQAAAAGCRASNGLGMLLRQGAAAFALWTGLEPDLRVMKEALGLPEV